MGRMFWMFGRKTGGRRGGAALPLAIAPVFAAVALFTGCNDNGGDAPGWYKKDPLADEFTLSTGEDLAGLAKIVNNGTDDFWGKTVRLANDIDLSAYGKNHNGGKGWVPIGNEAAPFRGIFDGGRKSVSGLYINDTTLNCAGLFGYINGGTVRNLGVVDVEVSGGGNLADSEADVGGVGGVVGESRGNVDDCHTTGTVRGERAYTGGVAGLVYGRVANCYSAATVSGSYCVGGVVGNGDADKCYATGAVSGGGSLGGVVGAGSAANCYAMGAVGSNGFSPTVGGVVGHGSATNCYATGAVGGIATSHYHLGGVVGVAYWSTVTNCAALNPRIGSGGNDAYEKGRVVGLVSTNSTISNNAAFIGISGQWDSTGVNLRDGEDITAAQIRADGTIGGRFIAANGWTVQNGMLPGLFGAAVPLPLHLRD